MKKLIRVQVNNEDECSLLCELLDSLKYNENEYDFIHNNGVIYPTYIVIYESMKYIFGVAKLSSVDPISIEDLLTMIETHGEIV